ncbi:MAG: flagellar biosynthesis protein FlhA [Eubacteriales bacterium]
MRTSRGMLTSFLSNIVSIFVIVIILMIIVPLSTGMLDFMYILNLALSLTILLGTMYIKEALEFSVFPSLLLITTLFRLALNVASTRLILLENGEAGQVIKTFGNFVIGSNPVIGFLIFLIIVIAQFIIITKGSERVAEVSARFTLDAMPGKQMAIDADLNSGLINEDQARERRSKIQREADFFGSMDGATKFVKGDAIVSILIMLINLIGGTIIGFVNSIGTFGEIMNLYLSATVGNGLVSQMTALLVSVSTGMMVTRSASESDLSAEVFNQFLSQPTALITGGVAIGALIIIPGFPVIQLAVVSASLISIGVVMRNRMKLSLVASPPEKTEVSEITSEAEYYRDVNNIYTLLSLEQIELEFGYSLLPLVDEQSGGSFIDRVVMLRKQFTQEMGFVIPSVKLRDSGRLNPNQYSIKLKGESVAEGDILVDHYLAIASDDVTEEIEGIETTEPAFGIPAKWFSEDKRIKAELAGYTLIDPTSVIITHLSEVIKRHMHELLSRQEVNTLIENLKSTNETLVNDTIPSIVKTADLQKVLSNLLQEGISIRDMETILETVADYLPTVKDTDLVTEYVRAALKRSITRKYSEVGRIKVVTLDADIENSIMSSVKKMETGSYLAMDPEQMQSIVQATVNEVNKVRELVEHPIVLTSPIVRIYFKRLIDQFYPNITVLSFNEIDQNVQIQSLGNIAIGI